MTYDSIAPEADEGKAGWPTAGARVKPDVLKMVDVAAAVLRLSRSEFIGQALEQHAHATLEREAPEMLHHFAA